MIDPKHDLRIDNQVVRKGPTFQLPEDANALDALLEECRFRADPLADGVIDEVFGGVNHIDAIDGGWQRRLERIRAVNNVLSTWTTNAAVWNWHGDHQLREAGIADPLERFVAATRNLPDWADTGLLERAEVFFEENGALPVAILFCASLPECYVLPDLSLVLQATAQLEAHTEYRIRATGSMIFPLMMRGGLTSGEGAGVAGVLKVRLIHAMIRHLILRDSPERLLEAMRTQSGTAGVVAANTSLADGKMYGTLLSHGWQLDEEGMPCDQEELAYTLLTFSYVCLRSMRKLGVPATPIDEAAYLHLWNVMAHFLGVDERLMISDFESGERLFAQIQARGRTRWLQTPPVEDPRPALGQALMRAMEGLLGDGVVRHFPVLMTRYLCGPVNARDIGVVDRAPPLARIAFFSAMAVAKLVDRLLRILSPQFSICRLLARVLGYRVIMSFLMKQTRPLNLPASLGQRGLDVVAKWGNDPRASGWVNRVEDWVTMPGDWRETGQINPKSKPTSATP